MLLDIEQPEKVRLPFFKRVSIKFFLPFLENVLLFLLFYVFSRMQTTYELGTLNMALLYITISSILYGLKQMYLSFPFALLLDLFARLDGNNRIISSINGNFFYRSAFYILVGLSIGIVIEYYRKQVQKKDQDIADLKQELDSLNIVHKEMKEMNCSLSSELNARQDILAKAYKWTKRLESLDPDEVLNASVEVTEDMMASGSVAVYVFKGSRNNVKLAAKSKTFLQAIESINNFEHSPIFLTLKMNKIFINRTFESNLPVMIAPIMVDENLMGMLSVYEMEFDKMTSYYENIFLIAAGFVSSAFARAVKYKHDVNLFINDPNIIKKF